MEVIWSPAAERDLADIRSHIAARNPFAAGRVSQSIRAAAADLAAFPLMGHVGESDTREWVVPDYPSTY